jgi:putative RNA 2'-phosphotransferase
MNPVRLSRLLSLMLRHRPEEFGLELDPEGFAPIDDVLRALKKQFPEVSEADLRRVVESVDPGKGRFSILDGDIRANYGHSIGERISHPRAEPPEALFHGTAESAVASILAQGLRPMRRQYVHLTSDESLSRRVGARHGRPVVLRVEALRAHRAGVAFYRANPAFWLADSIPPEFFAVVGQTTRL